MNMYTPAELVRLELLQHDNPESLHPVEEAWRDLARKLMQDANALNKALTKHHTRFDNSQKCFDCGLNKSNFVTIPEIYK